MRSLVPILSTSRKSFPRAFAGIRSWQEGARERADEVAREIVSRVRRQGDRALIAYTERFDGVRLTAKGLRIAPIEMERALDSLPRQQLLALRLAAARIRSFHLRQMERSWRYRDPIGLSLGQKIAPLEMVGVYVPGGKAAYPSSVLMNVIPARVAGVSEVIMVSPAGREGYNAAVLAAARIAGVSAVFRIGGAQAVAALAYGTETVPRVDKIVGPGNAYVQAAKRLVYGQVDIDSTAGPSEITIIADATADPSYVAADLLAQAEHGSGDECALLLTPSRRLAERTVVEISRQLDVLDRKTEILRVLRKRSAAIVVRNLSEAVELANQVAPEHLEIMVKDAEALLPQVHNAGAIFLGPYAPAVLGDYMAGPNHVLPTGGSARFFSPLGAYDFVKRSSIVSASERGLKTLGPAVRTLAELEGYTAHAAAIRRRFE